MINMENTRLIIIGSRKRNSPEDKKLLYPFIFNIDPIELVSGGCSTGGDKFAEEIAKEFNIPIKIFYPKFPWKYAKSTEKICHWCKYNIKNECKINGRCDGRKFFVASYHEIVKCYYARNDLIAEYGTHCCALESPTKDGGTAYTIKKFIEKHGKDNLYLL